MPVTKKTSSRPMSNKSSAPTTGKSSAGRTTPFSDDGTLVSGHLILDPQILAQRLPRCAEDYPSNSSPIDECKTPSSDLVYRASDKLSTSTGTGSNSGLRSDDSPSSPDSGGSASPFIHSAKPLEKVIKRTLPSPGPEEIAVPMPSFVPRLRNEQKSKPEKTLTRTKKDLRGIRKGLSFDQDVLSSSQDSTDISTSGILSQDGFGTPPTTVAAKAAAQFEEDLLATPRRETPALISTVHLPQKSSGILDRGKSPSRQDGRVTPKYAEFEEALRDAEAARERAMGLIRPRRRGQSPARPVASPPRGQSPITRSAHPLPARRQSSPQPVLPSSLPELTHMTPRRRCLGHDSLATLDGFRPATILEDFTLNKAGVASSAHGTDSPDPPERQAPAWEARAASPSPAAEPKMSSVPPPMLARESRRRRKTPSPSPPRHIHHDHARLAARLAAGLRDAAATAGSQTPSSDGNGTPPLRPQPPPKGRSIDSRTLSPVETPGRRSPARKQNRGSGGQSAPDRASPRPEAQDGVASSQSPPTPPTNPQAAALIEEKGLPLSPPRSWTSNLADTAWMDNFEEWRAMLLARAQTSGNCSSPGRLSHCPSEEAPDGFENWRASLVKEDIPARSPLGKSSVAVSVRA